MKRRAVFLDRDGTLVQPRHYPKRSEDLVPYTGIARQLRELRFAGFRLIVVTNQSGIARGYFSLEALDGMHRVLGLRLASEGARIDAFYFCPHHPDGLVREFAVECDCRKPRAGMLLRAARDLDIDLGSSWLVGDILDDIEAGNLAGCRTVLVDLGTERAPESELRQPNYIAPDTVSALEIIRRTEVIAMSATGPGTKAAVSAGGHREPV